MSLHLKPGTRVFGAACATELIVLRAPDHEIDLQIGGHPALLVRPAQPSGVEVRTPESAAPKVGKRYVDEAGTLEVLCTKAGRGALSVGAELLGEKGSKPLPASD